MKGIPSYLAAPRALTISIMQLKQNQLTLHALKVRMGFWSFPEQSNLTRQATHRTSVMLRAKTRDDGVTIPQSDQARKRHAGATLGSSARRNHRNKKKHLSRTPSHPHPGSPPAGTLQPSSTHWHGGTLRTASPRGVGARKAGTRQHRVLDRARRAFSIAGSAAAVRAAPTGPTRGRGSAPSAPRRCGRQPCGSSAAATASAPSTAPEGALRRRQEHYSGHKHSG